VSAPIAVVVFLVSLIATLAAAAIFARRLDVLGEHLGLPEALLGLLTAAGADAPELSSAIVALVAGSKGVGLGVVVGSNLFNVASMIGLSALVAGRIRVHREALVLEGGVAGGATLIAALLALEVLPAWLAVVLLLIVLLPYVAVISIAEGFPRITLPREARTAVRHALGAGHRPRPGGPSVRGSLLALPPAVSVIVLGSIGMVHAAIELGHRWHVPEVIVGTVVLAVLTSLPNAYTGVRLGRAGRDAALVSETMNSNTINLVGGLAIPALFISLTRPTALVGVDFAWLGAATVLALVLVGRRGGAGRRSGLLLVCAYLAFVTVQAAVS
jgi:cation:H+ antiporter